MLVRYLLPIALASVAPGYTAQPAPAAVDPSPHAIDVPPWFRENLLDLREDKHEQWVVNCTLQKRRKILAQYCP